MAKRDSNGNIVLQANDNDESQWVYVDVIKPQYDVDEIKKVLNTDINELYKSEFSTELNRLRDELEKLRQQLSNINLPEGGLFEPTIIEPDTIPGAGDAITLPDRSTGEYSTTPLIFNVNTAIWNDATQQIENIGSANPHLVKFFIVRNDLGQDVNYGSGVGTTEFFQSRLGNGNFINQDESYDVVFLLSSQNLENFNGWYFKNENSGDLNEEKYDRFSQNLDVRIKLLKRRNTGTVEIDTDRNTYEILLVFKNEAPDPTINNNSSLSLNFSLLERSRPILHDRMRGDYFTIRTYDVNKTLIKTSVAQNPFSGEFNKTDVNEIRVTFNGNLLPDNYTFSGWFEFVNNEWVKLTNQPTIILKNNFDERNIIATYEIGSVKNSPRDNTTELT